MYFTCHLSFPYSDSYTDLANDAYWFDRRSLGETEKKKRISESKGSIEIHKGKTQVSSRHILISKYQHILISNAIGSIASRAES